MSLSTPHTPLLRYDPSIERPEPDEKQSTAELVATMHKILETTYKDYGHSVRAVHAKSHGLLEGTLRVLEDLPPSLAQGIFAKPGNYPVIMRLSTNPGDILDDSVSTPRGLGIKIIGVEGARLPGAVGQNQDFVMAVGPAFSAKSVKAFLGNVKLLEKTTDTAQGLKKALSATLRGVEKVVEAFGGESATLKALGGYPETHILGETFYSQAAIRYGDYVAKVCAVPVSPGLAELTDAPLNVNGKPNGLREAVSEFFASTGGEWEIRVQLCTDLDAMPVEDSSVPWPEDKSPYLPVAVLVVAPQASWTDAKQKALDDGLAFSPWHGIEAHQPLGSIMRARKSAYEMSSQFRDAHNSQKISEPTREGCPFA